MVTPAPPPPAPMTWIMPWGQLAWLRAYDDKLARKFFDTPTSFVVGSTPVPGYAATVLPLFASFADYARAGNMQGSSFAWVAYDLEHWPKSPDVEQRHPKPMMYAFAALAHARGQKLVATPSRDIIYATAADDPWQWPETIDAGYLRCGIPGAARDAEALVCQCQGAEKDPVEYAQLLTGADKQSPPAQLLYGELTTNFATAAQMRAAYDAAALCGANIAGYWVVIPSQDQAGVAAEFFRGLP